MTLPVNSDSARDIAYHLHPYTDPVAHESRGPHIIAAGEGITVVDENGNRYLEGLAGLWCTALGFSEPRLIEAATAQMRKLPYYHSFAHRTSPPVIALAERLIELAPVPMAKVFFTNSGSEAIDTLIKITWYYNNAIGRPERKKIISRHRAYHGVTVAAASLTGLPLVQNGFDLPIANILHTDCPHHYRYGRKGESEEAFATRLAENLDKLIVAEDPDTVAAFIAEPVMGAGGVLVPPASYFGKIQEVLRRHDVMFIVDEVICGFGRTGNRFGSETYGLEPDMMSMAKALSSAYLPIAAVMISEQVYQGLRRAAATLGPFGMGYTYGGHPVAAAVALEALKIYDERDMLGHIRRVGPRMQARLRGFGDHPLVGNARGVGLIGAVELVRDKAGKEPFDPARMAGQRVAARALEHGLIVRPLADDTIAFCPPLIITETEVDEMFDRFARALDDAAADLGDAAPAER